MKAIRLAVAAATSAVVLLAAACGGGGRRRVARAARDTRSPSPTVGRR